MIRIALRQSRTACQETSTTHNLFLVEKLREDTNKEVLLLIDAYNRFIWVVEDTAARVWARAGCMIMGGFNLGTEEVTMFDEVEMFVLHYECDLGQYGFDVPRHMRNLPILTVFRNSIIA